jgi:hypothetical protein
LDKVDENGRKIHQVSEKDEMGETPLHRAAENGNLATAKFLIDKKAKLNIMGGEDDMTPLHYAARNGNVEMTNLLLDHGADVNKKTIDGNAAIHEAVAESENIDVVKALLNKGAKLFLKNGDGKSALDYVRGRSADFKKEFIDHIEELLGSHIKNNVPEEHIGVANDKKDQMINVLKKRIGVKVEGPKKNIIVSMVHSFGKSGAKRMFGRKTDDDKLMENMHAHLEDHAKQVEKAMRKELSDHAKGIVAEKAPNNQVKVTQGRSR